LKGSNFDAFIDARIYLRISLNAATDSVHQGFSCIPTSLSSILRIVEEYANRKSCSTVGSNVPLGATFLLSDQNWHELSACASAAKAAGVNHFSVRRVLGPPPLRPGRIDEQALAEQYDQARALVDGNFLVFLPWRLAAEPDLPANTIPATTCWQSLFKFILEPTAHRTEVSLALCGRYRGGGIGQLRQIPPRVLTDAEIDDMEGTWDDWCKRQDRRSLLATCPSCLV
jgi:hypothetical protein